MHHLHRAASSASCLSVLAARGTRRDVSGSQFQCSHMLPSHQQPYEQHMNASGRTACGLLVTALLTGDIGVFVLGQVEQSAAVRAKQQRTWTSSFRRRCLVTRAEANGHEAAHLSSRPVLASSEDIQLSCTGPCLTRNERSDWGETNLKATCGRSTLARVHMIGDRFRLGERCFCGPLPCAHSPESFHLAYTLRKHFACAVIIFVGSQQP